jgi:SNF2 family DNA or RNA helicase
LKAVARQPVCPLCRSAIEKNSLTEIIEQKQKEELNDKRELGDMVMRYGTKTAHLIKYLKDLKDQEKDSKVIIFSQWDDMLHRIGSSLTENGIKNVYCKGNVHQRNKAIEDFKKPEVYVIMLSLDNAASGTRQSLWSLI